MARSVTIKGLSSLIRKIDGMEQVLKEEVDAECEAAALEMNDEASQNITSKGITDTGELLAKQQMIPDRQNRSYLVVNTAFYAPFQEFGTGIQFIASPEWREVAAQFKDAQNGTFAVFLQKIKEWCRRKGIDEDLAYPICAAILQNGLEARPFMQPAFEKVAPLLIKRIKRIIKDALSA